MNLFRVLKDIQTDVSNGCWRAVDLGLKHYWELRQRGEPAPEGGDQAARSYSLRPGGHIRFTTSDGLPVQGRLLQWIAGTWYARVCGKVLPVPQTAI